MPTTAIPNNTLRRSTARDDGRPINNLPGLYPTADWVVHYWDVEPDGNLRSRQATIQLPAGYDRACRPISIGESGAVHQVRRWGVQCYTRILEEIGFDPSRYLSPDAERHGNVDGALLSVLLQATHFDLPGYFVIASDQHPLLLFGPDGTLKGSHTRWYSYLGVLAYLVSAGQVNRRFSRLYAANRALHDQALQYLLQALRDMERP